MMHNSYRIKYCSNWIALFLCMSLMNCVPLIAQSPATISVPNFRNNVRLVSVDIIVTDKEGVPLQDLKPEDFAITENGRPQRILSVDSHLNQTRSVSNTKSATYPSPGRTDRVTLNNAAAGSTVWNVILLDALDTSQDNQAQARKGVQEFIQTLPAHEQVALAIMDPTLRLIVPFKAGAGAIDALLKTAALRPKQSPLIDEYNPDDQAFLDKIEATLPDHGAAIESARQSSQTAQMRSRVDFVSDNFNALARWLGQYQGRKNVFWLSTGFPLIGVPSSRSKYIPNSTSPNHEDFSKGQDALGANLQTARVAIFPIDTRGVLGEFAGMQDATHNGSRYVGSAGALALETDMNIFSAEQRQEITEEMDIAYNTGGVAKFNSNDIGGMLQNAYRQGQSFYTLAYSPENKNWNGDYRKISINLNRRGYRLQYRRGYYATDIPSTKKTVDDFTLALRKDAPPASGVLFTTTLARSANNLVLDYIVDTKSLQFSTEPEGRSAGIDCAVVAYDKAGKVVATNQIHVDGKIKPEQWNQLAQAGFPAHQVIALPATSESISIGIRDHSSGAFGNMQIALPRQIN